MSEKNQALKKIIEQLQKSIFVTVAANVDDDLNKAFTVICGLNQKRSKIETITASIAMGATMKSIESKVHHDTQEMATLRTLMAGIFDHWHGLESVIDMKKIHAYVSRIKQIDAELIAAHQS